MATKTPADAAAKPAAKPRKPAAAKATAPKATAEKAKPVRALASPKVESAAPVSDSFLAQAQDKARKAANTGKDRATGALGDVAQMIEEVAKTIDDKLGGNYGDYARKASGTIAGVADNLNGKDVDELLDDARNFVRTQPAVAIGAAAALGFILTRLVKSGQDDNA